MRKTFRVAILAAVLVLASCTTIATHFPGVYAIDVDQGNIIDQEMIDQLRPEMNKRQVLYVLGTPLLVDVFHKDRWDYIYSVQPGSEDRMQKRITLFFKGDNLMGVQGDFRPSTLPVVVKSKDETVDVPKRELDKTFFQKIGALFGAGSDDDTVEKEADDEAEADDETLETEISTEEIETEPSDESDTLTIDEEEDSSSDSETPLESDTEVPSSEEEITETEPPTEEVGSE